MIRQITKAYVRHYADNGQVTAYVEWLDHRGRVGRTEGPAKRIGGMNYDIGRHMGQLFARADREGVKLQVERW